MQSQMIDLQSSIDRILAAVTQPGAPGVMPPERLMQSSLSLAESKAAINPSPVILQGAGRGPRHRPLFTFRPSRTQEGLTR
jgi:hypothetical protein